MPNWTVEDDFTPKTHRGTVILEKLKTYSRPSHDKSKITYVTLGEYRWKFTFMVGFENKDAYDEFMAYIRDTPNTMQLEGLYNFVHRNNSKNGYFLELEAKSRVHIYCDINNKNVVEKYIDRLSNFTQIPVEVIQDMRKTLGLKELKDEDIFEEFKSLFEKLKQGDSLKPLFDKAMDYQSKGYHVALLALAQAAYHKGNNEFAKEVLNQIGDSVYSKLSKDMRDRVYGLKAEIAIWEAGVDSNDMSESKTEARSLDEDKENINKQRAKAAEAYKNLISIENPDERQKRLIDIEVERYYGGSGFDLRFEGHEMTPNAETVLYLVDIVKEIEDENRKLRKGTESQALEGKQFQEQSTQTLSLHPSSVTLEVKEELFG